MSLCDQQAGDWIGDIASEVVTISQRLHVEGISVLSVVQHSCPDCTNGHIREEGRHKEKYVQVGYAETYIVGEEYSTQEENTEQENN